VRPYANPALYQIDVPALYQIDVPALSYIYAAYGKSGLISNETSFSKGPGEWANCPEQWAS
jgi:hypothetical protein